MPQNSNRFAQAAKVFDDKETWDPTLESKYGALWARMDEAYSRPLKSGRAILVEYSFRAVECVLKRAVEGAISRIGGVNWVELNTGFQIGGWEIMANDVEEYAGDMEARPSTVTQSLVSERARLMKRVEEIDSVLDTLKSEPGAQKVIDALASLGRLRNL